MLYTAHTKHISVLRSWQAQCQLEAIKARPKYSSAFIDADTIIVLRDDDPVTYGNHCCDSNVMIRTVRPAPWCIRRRVP
jgi:hypothetical protein